MDGETLSPVAWATIREVKCASSGNGGFRFALHHPTENHGKTHYRDAHAISTLSTHSCDKKQEVELP